MADYLAEFGRQHEGDPRIVIVTKENGGISSALNAALERATGDYVGMLDHDDLLDRRCIEAFSRALEENGFPDAVYSDEDKVNARGEHFELYCKPSFSPELLLTQMYLCHFTIFRTEAVKRVGGLRTEMDGAQDFDLALRLLPELAQRRPPAAAVLPLAGVERVDRAHHRRQAVGAGCGGAGPGRSSRADLRRRLRRPERGARAERGAPAGGGRSGRVGDHPDHRHAERRRHRHASSTTPCTP